MSRVTTRINTVKILVYNEVREAVIFLAKSESILSQSGYEILFICSSYLKGILHEAQREEEAKWEKLCNCQSKSQLPASLDC